MQHNITELARNASATPREADREVVAAISSAEGSAKLLRGGGRAFGYAVPLLALAAGMALGYGSIRWLRPSPSPRRRLVIAASDLREPLLTFLRRAGAYNWRSPIS